MHKVNGIGGVFFRARDPAALTQWYAQHLGVDPVTQAGPWCQDGGMTVFAPFPMDTDYFDRPEQQWMLNFRVDDLPGMIAQLQAAGIAVETRAEWNNPQVGQFARIHDPEGNPVELWQPAPPGG
ncbi:VOC family protein [Puniceibacterium sp. IMCC21224]|uniref:VOC family protein n=1 Tax=Puniceibacterium sp. IMCC21224 TaxID=1618204 RepID=UPI00064DB7F8|nr:VOC family protein [Puniceibacterium sp. IMCC21224]KMK67850.1 Glyoxalase-like domain [Puniceibacterium sp. IMCC21224]